MKEVKRLESKDIYQKSYEELDQILRVLASDSVTIHFDRLDTNTKEELITAIRNTAYKRKREIDSVRLGVQ